MRFLNLVRFTSSTTGTSDIAVGGAVSGFSTPAAAGVANGDRVPYVIVDAAGGKAWGIGTYSTTGPTLARDADEVRLVSGTRTSAKLSIDTSCEVYFDAGEGNLQRKAFSVVQASAASITPDPLRYDNYDLTAQAATLTINNPTGSPRNADRFTVHIKDNGTARGIFHGDKYRAVDKVLPTETIQAKILRIEYEYIETFDLWLCVDYKFISYSAGIIHVGTWIAGHSGDTGGTTINVSSLGFSIEEGDFILTINAAPAASQSYKPTSASGVSLTAHGQHNFYDGIYLNHYPQYGFWPASPPSTIYFTGSGSSAYASVFAVLCFKGIDPASPVDTSATTSQNSATTVVDPPSNTPVTDETVSVVIGSGYSNCGAMSSPDLDSFSYANGIDTGSYSLGVGIKKHSDTSAFDPGAWTHSNLPNHIASHMIFKAA